MDYSPLGSSVHGMSQARMLEQVAIAVSRASSPSRVEPAFPALQLDPLLLSHWGSNSSINAVGCLLCANIALCSSTHFFSLILMNPFT